MSQHQRLTPVKDGKLSVREITALIESGDSAKDPGWVEYILHSLVGTKIKELALEVDRDNSVFQFFIGFAHPLGVNRKTGPAIVIKEENGHVKMGFSLWAEGDEPEEERFS